MKFKVLTINEISVRITQSHWDRIVLYKHPSIKDKEDDVKEALKIPDEIRVSKSDNKVLLYYKKLEKYYICVVVKILNGEGFIITAYITENIKEGVRIWQK